MFHLCCMLALYFCSGKMLIKMLKIKMSNHNFIFFNLFLDKESQMALFTNIIKFEMESKILNTQFMKDSYSIWKLMSCLTVKGSSRSNKKLLMKLSKILFLFWNICQRITADVKNTINSTAGFDSTCIRLPKS